MIYQQLGNSELSASRIGFGCMSLKPGQDNVSNLVDAAIAGGINFFDTADLYDKGLNETMIGKVLATKRQQLIIATKVGNQWREDGSAWDWNPTKKYILRAVDNSLKRLQTDYIDLYQLHGGTIDDDIDDTIDAFETLKQQGKIRYYGISSIRPNVIREYVKRSNISTVMMQYSLLDRRPEETCLQLLKENNIGVLARGTVAGGLLVDKTAKDYLGHSAAIVAAAAKAIKEIGENDLDPATAAIQFALQQPGISTAVVGMHTDKQLSAALKAIIKAPIPANSLQRLDEVVSANKYSDHR